MRRGPGSAYRKWKSIEFLLTRDRAAVSGFLRRRFPATGRAARLAMLRAFVTTTNAVRGYHTLGEILRIVDAVLERSPSGGGPGPVVVEAGCGKGASTAKISLAVRAARGSLAVFDSFRGIPANEERHVSLDGRSLRFREGAFRATLPSVTRVVERYGAPEVCTFHKGWFADTLREAPDAIDVAWIDVDLESSTRDCLKELVPRLRPGGVLFSHDGHIRAVVDLLRDGRFWRDEVGVEPPSMRGVGREKLVEVAGPTSSAVVRPRRRRGA